MAASGDVVERAFDRSNGGDTSGEATGKKGAQTAAIRETGGINAMGVYAEVLLQVIEHVTGEGYLVHAKVYGAEFSKEGFMQVRFYHALRIDGEKVLLVGKW